MRQGSTGISRKILGLSFSQVSILAFLGFEALVGLIVVGIFIVRDVLVSPAPPGKATQLSLATQSSATPLPTRTSRPTITRRATSTPRASPTPQQSPTAAPPTPRRIVVTSTPDLSIALPTPEPGGVQTIELTKNIGPIQGLEDKSYTLQIAITGVGFTMGGLREPPTGDYRYIVIHLNILNLGPGIAPGLGNFGFHLVDDREVIHTPVFVNSASTCFLDTIDLEIQESHSGCIAFEISKFGGLTLVYQPVWNNPSLFTSFTIR